MKITIVLKAPFIERIPSLKNLVIYMASHNIIVKIISTTHTNYPQPKFDAANITMINSKMRTRRFQMPTTIGLCKNILKDIIFDKSDLYIGGDMGGCNLIMRFQKCFNLRYWNFLLEYPDINNHSVIELLKRAEKIITHDKWHSDFLLQHFETTDSQFLYLPNATYTNETHRQTSYLKDLLGLRQEDIVLLHSGGFGKWFLCEELICASKYLDKNQIIVFHTSHNVSDSAYFKHAYTLMQGNTLPVKFSLTPVSDDELDTLVSSATIGLAFYSLKELGYRAENMGLAAGKIGNYLKCGIPVICTRVHSLEYIEKYKCGVLIDSFDELPTAVHTILDSLEEYRRNAYKCYRELWEPTTYLEVIYKQLFRINPKV